MYTLFLDSGAIPSSFAGLTSLNMLALSDNDLESPIPSLAKLTGLTNLRLDHNLFMEVLPEWISNLTNLTILALLENRFFGRLIFPRK